VGFARILAFAALIRAAIVADVLGIRRGEVEVDFLYWSFDFTGLLILGWLLRAPVTSGHVWQVPGDMTSWIKVIQL
jgi:hypothetical protein